MALVIHKPHLCTRLDIYAPRYSDIYKAEGEAVALLACYKVYHASPVIIVSFSRRPHLAGQRFAIRRSEVERCKRTTNGKIECFAVPMSKFDNWESAQEVYDLAMSAFEF